jgi:hypothetical protein
MVANLGHLSLYSSPDPVGQCLCILCRFHHPCVCGCVGNIHGGDRQQDCLCPGIFACGACLCACVATGQGKGPRGTGEGTQKVFPLHQSFQSGGWPRRLGVQDRPFLITRGVGAQDRVLHDSVKPLSAGCVRASLISARRYASSCYVLVPARDQCTLQRPSKC